MELPSSDASMVSNVMPMSEPCQAPQGAEETTSPSDLHLLLRSRELPDAMQTDALFVQAWLRKNSKAIPCIVHDHTVAAACLRDRTPNALALRCAKDMAWQCPGFCERTWLNQRRAAVRLPAPNTISSWCPALQSPGPAGMQAP